MIKYYFIEYCVLSNRVQIAKSIETDPFIHKPYLDLGRIFLVKMSETDSDIIKDIFTKYKIDDYLETTIINSINRDNMFLEYMNINDTSANINSDKILELELLIVKYLNTDIDTIKYNIYLNKLYLTNTDWMVIKSMETGIPLVEDIRTKRENARLLINELELKIL